VVSRRPLRLLLITLLALTSLGSAQDAAEAPATPGGLAVLAGSSITCSTAWPSATVGCWWERPLLVLGAVELAVGVDAQAVLTGSWEDAHLAPYIVAAAYLDTWAAWIELRLPELAGVPTLGSPDWLRAGFTLRFPP